MKLTLPFLAVALALTTFACASQTDDAKSADSDIVAAGHSCGTGVSGITLSCQDDEYCDFGATGACGVADQMGTCRKKPFACPAVVMPVCGCDGKAYGNSCEAERAGATIAHDGTCETIDPPPPPFVCPDVYTPVCGADGKTYGNSCFAAQQHTTVAHDGTCE